MNARPEEMAHVLVAEDELLVALELSSMIEDAGYTVLGPAPTTRKALLILAEYEPVAAFLDENLNGVSIAPVAQELARRQIPFVIVSGYTQSTSDDPLLRTARRIQKPVSRHHIEDALADFLSASSSPTAPQDG